jgi:hypothetical protein
VNLTNRGREKTQIRDEKGDIKTHTSEIWRSIRKYFESTKLENSLNLKI